MLQDLGFERDDKAAAQKFFKLDIVKIGLVEKREMNEEFSTRYFLVKELKLKLNYVRPLKRKLRNIGITKPKSITRSALSLPVG
jgi:trigger factor